MPRPRLTDKNIANQAETAPAGTIVHHCGCKTCERKNNKTDAYEAGKYPYDPNDPWKSLGTTGEATHIENVTCLHCRKEYHQARKEWYAKKRATA